MPPEEIKEPKHKSSPASSIKPGVQVDGIQARKLPAGPKGSRGKLPWILGGAGVLLIAAIAGVLTLGKSPVKNTNQVSNTNAGDGMAQVPRALDGVLANSNVANPTPVAVMVENIVEARPQSGLNDASVVYEALAEGGITRFLAIFGPFTNTPEIGPVRSARPYYVDWAEEYKAVYAHVGGSPQALQLLQSYRGIDLNEFFNSRYFWRDHSRLAPHNAYTSAAKLIFARRDFKAPDTGSFTPWTFLSSTATTQHGTSERISIPFSSFNYSVQWDYNSSTNAYDRSQAGKPHLLKDGSRVSATNVIVQYVKTSLLDTERLTMETIGTGRATVFHDGLAFEGTWIKTKRGDHTQFVDTSGNPIPLEPGRTWVEVVPSDRTVTAT